METVSLARQVLSLGSFGLCLLLFCCNSKENKIHDNPLNLDKNKQNVNYKGGKLFVNDSLFSGQLYTMFPKSTDTATIEKYEVGLENGIWKKYYAKNHVQEIRHFLKGKKVGIYETWWPNGKLQTQYFFENDEYQGTCKEWAESGLLVKIMNYNKGHEQGVQKWWYENGKIKANYVIKEGRRFGLLGTKNCINVADSIFAD